MYQGSEEQKANLARLADFLEGNSFPSWFSFNMGRFCKMGERSKNSPPIDYETYINPERDIFSVQDLEDAAEDDPRVHACGTAGCAVGCIPFIAPKLAKEINHYFKLCTEFTGVCPSGINSATGFWERHSAWEYLFSPRWVFVDNTREGAAKRIRRFLALDCTVPPPEEWWDIDHPPNDGLDQEQ